MSLAYFDCFSGAGGDMIVAALIDAGAHVEQLRARLATLSEPSRAREEAVTPATSDTPLPDGRGSDRGGFKEPTLQGSEKRGRGSDQESPLPDGRGTAGRGSDRGGFKEPTLQGYTLHIEKVKKQGFAATRFRVDLDAQTKQPHRHLKHVVQIIHAADLPALVKERSIAIFTRLAEAEAKVHGSTIEKVHFHEVGAIDAIIDVVGAVTALDLLGVERVLCSAIPVGSGTVKCEHGVMPVPAPAVAEMLKGIPIATCDEVGEMTTPTAAAILTTLCTSFGPVPDMTIRSVGYGAGTRDGLTRPNVLRVLIGDAAHAPWETDQVAVLETNVDDATPQVIGFCMERLLAAGALDVYSVPIQMKKHRPGVVLTVLCAPGDAAVLERIIFAETPTLGIRRRTENRSKLSRRVETVQTEYGPIRVKIGEGDGLLTVTPEYEDCKAAALKHNVPLHKAMDAARRLTGWNAGPTADGE